MIPTDKPGKSGDEISFACNIIMYEQYVILYCIIGPISRGPISRGPNGHDAPPLRYKREAPAVQRRQNTLRRTLELAPNSSVLSNTVHSGRRVLRSGGPNHSKPAVFIVFLSEIELVASYPPSTHPMGLGGCIPPPGCGLPHHDIIESQSLQVGAATSK